MGAVDPPGRQGHPAVHQAHRRFNLPLHPGSHREQDPQLGGSPESQGGGILQTDRHHREIGGQGPAVRTETKGRVLREGRGVRAVR